MRRERDRIGFGDEHALRVLRSEKAFELGLEPVDLGHDALEVRGRDHVLDHDEAEFVELERHYWATFTPTGFIFKLGVLMALFVGCIIVYQILYSDVSEHLPEYATLKAMGYPDRYLFKLVIQESFILSVLGFVPGVLVSQLVYNVSKDATLLPLRMTLERGVAVYFLTMLMCMLSATLATRRLKAADPAEIF